MSIISNLILLTIGVNNYAVDNDTFAKEAKYFRENIVKKSIYEVKEKSYFSRKATKKNCIRGLRWVEKNAQTDDLAIVYLGGHGNNRSGYYKIEVKDKSICSNEIIKCLEKIECKLLLIVDTCHSGAIIEDWEDMPPNINIITACKSEQPAYTWKLVKPLVAALDKADYNKDGVIDIEEIQQYVIKNIERQNPVCTKGDKIPICKSQQTQTNFLIPYMNALINQWYFIVPFQGLVDVLMNF